jgi:hypothetical protein
VDSGLFGRSTVEDGTDMLQRGVQFAVDAPQLATLADLTSDIEAEAGLRLVDGDDAGPAALGDGASVVGLDWATVHLVFCHIFTCSAMVIIIGPPFSARSAVLCSARRAPPAPRYAAGRAAGTRTIYLSPRFKTTHNL